MPQRDIVHSSHDWEEHVPPYQPTGTVTILLEQASAVIDLYMILTLPKNVHRLR